MPRRSEIEGGKGVESGVVVVLTTDATKSILTVVVNGDMQKSLA